MLLERHSRLVKKNQENHAGMLQLNLKPQTEEGIHREKHKRGKKRERLGPRETQRKIIAREERKGLNNLFFIPDGLR